MLSKFELYFKLKQFYYLCITLPKRFQYYYVVIAFIVKNKNSRIGLIYTSAIGPLLNTYEVLKRREKLKQLKSKDIVFITPTMWANQYFRKKMYESFNIIESDELFVAIEHVGLSLLKYLNRYEEGFFNNGFCEWGNFEVSFNFDPSEVNEGKRLCRKVGLDLEKPFVCISCKDNFYWKKLRGENKYWDIYRDTSFSELEPAVEYLNQKGYQVVRLSAYDSKEKSNWIDISALSKDEREFMDFYLHAKCTFAVHGDSGIAIFPILFQKPLLIHNFIPMGESPVHELGIYLPKILTREKKLIPISDYFKITSNLIELTGIGLSKKVVTLDKFQNIKYYKDNNVEITNSTQRQIKDGIDELITYFVNGKPINEEDRKLIVKFKNKFPEKHQLKNSPAIISPSFLKDHLGLLG